MHRDPGGYDRKKKYQNWLDRTFYVGSAPMPEPANEPIRLSLEMLDDFIRRFPVDEKRLMITGASNGGYATWDIICRYGLYVVRDTIHVRGNLRRVVGPCYIVPRGFKDSDQLNTKVEPNRVVPYPEGS